MRAIVRLGVVGIVGAGMLLAGCADPNISPRQVDFAMTNAKPDTVAMGPNLRLIMNRPRHLTTLGYGPTLPTICTEPSPDVAVAFGRTLAGQGSYAGPNSTTISGSVNATSKEAATELAGRTAGVLALRDGLYAACQSYANGVLGHDAYAMILSQYGHLLVALAGTGKDGNPEPMTAKEAAISALLVACVSENDPTRLTPIYYEKRKHRYGALHNPLLTPQRCETLIRAITRGNLLSPPAKAAKKSTPTKQAALNPGEKVITSSKTTTIKAGPPQSLAPPATGASK